MRKNPAQTPLLALLRSLNDEQRAALAEDAGTSVSYLYSLASCQREACRTALALRIQQASERMHEHTGGLTPIVTMAELATMCAVGQ